MYLLICLHTQMLMCWLVDVFIDPKRRSAFHYDLWCLKYLPKFKWHHLTEDIGTRIAPSCQLSSLTLPVCSTHKAVRYSQLCGVAGGQLTLSLGASSLPKSHSRTEDGLRDLQCEERARLLLEASWPGASSCSPLNKDVNLHEMTQWNGLLIGGTIPRAVLALLSVLLDETIPQFMVCLHLLTTLSRNASSLPGLTLSVVAFALQQSKAIAAMKERKRKVRQLGHLLAHMSSIPFFGPLSGPMFYAILVQEQIKKSCFRALCRPWQLAFFFSRAHMALSLTHHL